MEFVYRIMIFSLPFVVSLITFFWLGRKTIPVPNRIVRILAFAVIAAGIYFTAWQFTMSYERALRDDAFNFKVIFFNIFFFIAVAILIALGTPEEIQEEKK
jgi:cytochrome c oxidase assembly factor CtaG